VQHSTSLQLSRSEGSRNQPSHHGSARKHQGAKLGLYREENIGDENAPMIPIAAIIFACLSKKMRSSAPGYCVGPEPSRNCGRLHYRCEASLAVRESPCSEACQTREEPGSKAYERLLKQLSGGQ